MIFINRTTVVGNLAKDAEKKDFDNGSSVINFTVAHTESWKDAEGNWKEKTNWYECQYWGKNEKAEIVVGVLKKGVRVMVEGISGSRAWIGSNGEAASASTIRVLNYQVCQSYT